MVKSAEHGRITLTVGDADIVVRPHIGFVFVRLPPLGRPLADQFVEDPHEIVKVSDRVQVRVLGIDHDRERIALSMKALDNAPVPVSAK